MSYDASDPRQVKERKKAVVRKETKREAVVQQLMRSEEGRDWVWELLAMCHMFQTSMNTNALSMAFAEGERNIGLRIYADLVRLCPGLYLTMIEEKSDGRDRPERDAGPESESG